MSRHNVMCFILCFDDSYIHLHWPKQFRNFGKFIRCEPINILYCLINCILSLLSCSMACFPLAIQSSTIRPLSATAICICVGSPTIAQSIGPSWFSKTSIPLGPEISSSAEAAIYQGYISDFLFHRNKEMQQSAKPMNHLHHCFQGHIVFPSSIVGLKGSLVYCELGFTVS